MSYSREAKKVYCIEKNEIYPSVTFVKDRINASAWGAIADPTKTCGGLHYRYATEEDLLNGVEANPSDYPKREKKEKKVAVINSDGEKAIISAPIRRGWTNEELEKWNKARKIADSMTNYLNQLESIFTSPMSDNEKIEAFNMAALFVGKLMVSFCDFCETQEIYIERGSRGGKIKNKKIEEENKEDDYEFIEDEEN